MNAKRPDRARYLEALDLDEQSEPWEVLVRSGGRRAGDTIEVLPEPVIGPDGATSCVFLVHGVRHCGPQASAEICGLSAGDSLALRWEEDNPVNPRAVLVLNNSGTELGYVPDPLVEYVQTVMTASEARLSVVRANGPEVGSHLRLLVRLDGFVPVGYQPFPAPVNPGP
ncbi:HIRAN domain-containing protein [Nocardioides dokdonensis]